MTMETESQDRRTSLLRVKVREAMNRVGVIFGCIKCMCEPTESLTVKLNLLFPSTSSTIVEPVLVRVMYCRRLHLSRQNQKNGYNILTFGIPSLFLG